MNSTARCAGRLVAVVGLCAGSLVPASASLLASFENDTEGWTINTDENGAYAFNGFSTTDGVTDGSYAAIVTGSAAPSYGQMLVGPTSTALTPQLATATEVSIDVATAAGAFDWGSQWTAVINNADLGYVSLDGFSYTGSVGPGSPSTTLSWPITADQRATLAGSAGESTLIFQVGGGGGGTMYVDNVRLTAIPEPTALALASLLGAAALTGRRR